MKWMVANSLVFLILQFHEGGVMKSECNFGVACLLSGLLVPVICYSPLFLFLCFGWEEHSCGPFSLDFEDPGRSWTFAAIATGFLVRAAVTSGSNPSANTTSFHPGNEAAQILECASKFSQRCCRQPRRSWRQKEGSRCDVTSSLPPPGARSFRRFDVVRKSLKSASKWIARPV